MRVSLSFALLLPLLAIACVTAPGQTISGVVSGLAGSVTLQNNGGDNVTLTASGPFTFPTAVAGDSNYNVTVLVQPVGQNCAVSDGSGSVSNAPVTGVTVSCGTQSGGAFTLGGTVSGSNNGTLVLTNSGSNSETLQVVGDQTFHFTNGQSTGDTYNVAVTTQPPGRTCAVSNASGSINASNVTNIGVTCGVATYVVSGTIVGLSGQVSIRNGGDTLTIASPTASFSFPTPLSAGQEFNVSVAQNPVNQSCTFDRLNGTVGTDNANNLVLTCVSTLRTISVSVTGLNGTLQLQDNGADTLVVTKDGGYTFATGLPDGAAFDVTVASQPPAQACVLVDGNGFGTLAGFSIDAINIQCTSPVTSYTIGGIAAGLSGNVTLNNAGIDTMVIPSSGGAFTFATPMVSGSFYDATIVSSPNTQVCTVTRVDGTTITESGGPFNVSENIDTLRVNCATGYTVGGTITGLTGTLRLQYLQNLPNYITNSSGFVTIAASSTSYTFPTRLINQASYAVSVLSQPAGQTCTVSSSTGNINATNVSNVNVSCVTGSPTSTSVGGSVVGLSGGSLVLTNNGLDTLTVTQPGNFTFAQSLAVNGVYNVAVKTQPAGQLCFVLEGTDTGTVSTKPITSVTVDCFASSVITAPVTGLNGSITIETSFPIGTNTYYGSTTAVSGNGASQTLTSLLPNGLDVTLVISTQPAHQQCLILHPSQTVGAVSGLSVVCGPFYSFITGQNANVVVGQANFLSKKINGGNTAPSANTLYGPDGSAWVSNSNQVFFPDFANNRVLAYSSQPSGVSPSASFVVGQSVFTTATSSPIGAASLSGPQKVSGDATHLMVTDFLNSRVLIYSPRPTASAPSATVVVGQTSFSATASTCASNLNDPEGAMIVNGKLIVADSSNNRVLIWNTVPTTNGLSPNVVLGLGGRSTCVPPTNPNESTLNYPTDVWSDGTHLAVVDSHNARVLLWSTFPTADFAPADAVLGQNDFVSFGTGLSSSNLSLPSAITSNGEQLFVADTGNNRVLIWNSLPELWGNASGTSADVVLGQVGLAGGFGACNAGSTSPNAATLCKPTGVFVNGPSLYVTDTTNNRHLIYQGF